MDIIAQEEQIEKEQIEKDWKERARAAWAAQEAAQEQIRHEWQDLQFARTAEIIADMGIAHPSDIHYSAGGRATVNGIIFGVDQETDVLFLCATCVDCAEVITSYRVPNWEMLGRLLDSRPCQESAVWWHQNCPALSPAAGPTLLVAAKAAHEALDTLWHDFSQWPASVTAAMFDLRTAIESAERAKSNKTGAA